MNTLIERIPAVDDAAYAAARDAYDAKTKPRGSLGRLEELGCRLAGIRGFAPRTLDAVIVVAAADHGVAREGVSAYPQEVTLEARKDLRWRRIIRVTHP